MPSARTMAGTTKQDEREVAPPGVKTSSSAAKLKALRAMVEGDRTALAAANEEETGERRAITLDGLQKEFGPVKGRKLYFGISEFLRAGAGDDYTPPIQLPMKSKGKTPTGESVNLAEQREAIEAMLSEAKGGDSEESGKDEPSTDDGDKGAEEGK